MVRHIVYEFLYVIRIVVSIVNYPLCYLLHEYTKKIPLLNFNALTNKKFCMIINKIKIYLLIIKIFYVFH